MEELYKILISINSNEDMVNLISYLKKADILDLTELFVVIKVLEQIEMLNSYNLLEIIEEQEIQISGLNEIKPYPSLEIQDRVDNFILERKNKRIDTAMNKSIKELNDSIITKRASKLFFDRYSDIISIHDDHVFEELEDGEINYDCTIISSANGIVDRIIGGVSYLTTIVGDNSNCKSLWALNIAYKALGEEKNVLYISLGIHKQLLYKRLLTRHSCDVDKFNTRINLDNPSNYKSDNYKSVYYDFKNNYHERLIVFDESEFIISTHYSLQKLIVYAQRQFIEKYGNGIDLIVIDDFTYMKLDDGKRHITNKRTIAGEYYKYLRNQSKNFLNTRKSIPIVVTICDIDGGNHAMLNDGKFSQLPVLDEIISLSDNILTIYDLSRTKKKMLKIQVVQSVWNDVMEEPKTIEVDTEYWYMKYDYDSDVPSQEKLKTKEEQNKELELKIEELTERNNELFNELIKPKEPSVEITLDDILNMKEEVTIDFGR